MNNYIQIKFHNCFTFYKNAGRYCLYADVYLILNCQFRINVSMEGVGVSGVIIGAEP